MTDEPTGWVTPAYRSNKHVFHTDDECPKLPSASSVRPLGENEIVSRELRECATCAADGQDSGPDSPCVPCPYCDASVRLRHHLPCPDGGDE